MRCTTAGPRASNHAAPQRQPASARGSQPHRASRSMRGPSCIALSSQRNSLAVAPLHGVLSYSMTASPVGGATLSSRSHVVGAKQSPSLFVFLRSQQDFDTHDSAHRAWLHSSAGRVEGDARAARLARCAGVQAPHARQLQPHPRWVLLKRAEEPGNNFLALPGPVLEAAKQEQVQQAGQALHSVQGCSGRLE